MLSHPAEVLSATGDRHGRHDTLTESDRTESDRTESDRFRADCGRCAGLCCVALPLAVSADFAIDKPADAACPNLDERFRCRIHTTLRRDGFAGCVAFDCYGAGQHVTDAVFGGVDWRSRPDIATDMFAMFRRQQPMFEVLRLLDEARNATTDPVLRTGVAEAIDRIDRGLDELDPRQVRELAAPLLAAVSAGIRVPPGPDHTRADLSGRRLRGVDLRRASLRGALLLGTDLRGADLRASDLLGADLRGARLDGANLGGALFLTRPQVDAATGDRATVLPSRVDRPAHWQR